MGTHCVPSYRLSISALSVSRRVVLIASSAVPIFPMILAIQSHLQSTSPGASFLAMFLVVALSIPAHEAMHGLIFWMYAGHASFGFKPWTSLGPVFYATSPGSRFTRRQYQLACVAPQLLTVLACLILATVPLPDAVFVGVAYAAALNLGGGVVDLLVFATLFRFPRDAQVEDTQTGMDVFLSLRAD